MYIHIKIKNTTKAFINKYPDKLKVNSINPYRYCITIKLYLQSFIKSQT